MCYLRGAGFDECAEQFATEAGKCCMLHIIAHDVCQRCVGIFTVAWMTPITAVDESSMEEKFQRLLEKKWTAIVRLQRKV